MRETEREKWKEEGFGVEEWERRGGDKYGSEFGKCVWLCVREK